MALWKRICRNPRVVRPFLVLAYFYQIPVGISNGNHRNTKQVTDCGVFQTNWKIHGGRTNPRKRKRVLLAVMPKRTRLRRLAHPRQWRNHAKRQEQWSVREAPIYRPRRNFNTRWICAIQRATMDCGGAKHQGAGERELRTKSPVYPSMGGRNKPFEGGI